MTDCIPIHPTAEWSKSKFCMCTACHKMDYVLMVEWQETGYWLKDDGTRPLSQKIKSLWLCDECRKKMLECLNEERKENNEVQ